MNDTLLHASDPHVDEREYRRKKPRKDFKWRDTRAGRFAQISEHIWEHEPKNAAFIITGDLTESCTEWELEMCQATLANHVDTKRIPGNHDGGGGGLWFLERRYDRFHDFVGHNIAGPESYPIAYDYPNYRLILLDSCHPMSIRRWTLARGMIGRTQLRKLEVLLDTQKLCIVAVHHHPEYRGFGLEMVDADEFRAAMENSPGAVHVLCGHRHHEDYWIRNGVHYRAAGRCTDDMAYHRITIAPSGIVTAEKVFVCKK